MNESRLTPSLKPYAAIIAGLIIAIGGGVVLAADNFGSVVNFYNSAGDTVLGSVVDGVAPEPEPTFTEAGERR